MPDLVLARETAAFLELSPEEVARLKNFPNIVTHFEYGPLEGTYILPPITYPDGKTYLKVTTLYFDHSMCLNPLIHIHETKSSGTIQYLWVPTKLGRFTYYKLFLMFLVCLSFLYPVYI